MSEQNQRVAVITGGSQGIGAGLVAAYRQRGWAVVANARTIEDAGRGIRVNAVAPGIIATHPADSYESLGQGLPPLGRVGQIAGH